MTTEQEKRELIEFYDHKSSIGDPDLRILAAKEAEARKSAFVNAKYPQPQKL